MKALVLLVIAMLNCEPVLADWKVGFKSGGPIKLGMSLQQVNHVLGERFVESEILGPDPTGSCFQVELKKEPGVELMFIGRKLARIDFSEPRIYTANGVGVGDSEATVVQAYSGRISRSSHAYVENGAYLTTLDSSHKYGIRFEIESGKVSRFYAGSAESIQYVEGCA